MIKLIFVLVGFIYFTSANQTQQLYYEQLINKTVEEAQSYTFSKDASRYQPIKPKKAKDFGNYDFIIIGAGVTGSVLANRLSENRKWKILVIEAGNYSNEVTDIPGLAWLGMNSDYNWGFYSTPQEHGCLGFNGERCPIPRGRGVGGGSLINVLMVSRGNPADYDKWASLGNPGWSYEEVLPYFLKAEDFEKNDPDAPVNWDYHGVGGYQHVSYSSVINSRSEAFLNAHVELGYNITDYNSPDQLGASPIQLILNNGSRYDTGTAFIKPVLSRKNLKVLTNSYVTKIRISSKSKKASGVHFTTNNKKYYARAKREVIVSAGAIQTPQILMLSGVGPKSHLKELGINVVKDLEVGSSLRDHVAVNLFFTHNATDNLNTTLEEDVQDYLNETGKLTAFAATTMSFYTSKFETNASYADIEYVLMPFILQSIPDLSNKVVQYKIENLLGLTAPIGTNNFCSGYLGNLHTKSIGTVRLNSSNPFDYPLINPNFLSNVEDVDRLYEALLQFKRLLETDSLKQINFTLVLPDLLACKLLEEDSQEYWTCVFRQIAIPGYHPVGTCPMGPDPKQGAVVNAKLEVHGVKKLRVADASVFPFTLSNHPMITCVMIGEKLASIINEEHK